MRTLHRLAQITFALSVLWATTVPATAQTLFVDDFEAGFAGWTMTGQWNPESSADTCGGNAPEFPTGGQMAAYFGNDTSCSFMGTWQGNLTTIVPISIPETDFDVTLRFWSYDAVECASCDWDWRFVYVSTDAGQTWEFVGESASFFEWHETELSLAGYEGQDILLRFHFDAVDDVWNNELGWLIDAVRIELDCDLPTNVCTSLNNSEGHPAVMNWSGSTSVAADDFALQVEGVPPGHQGTFFYGSASSFIVFGDGIQCVGAGSTGVFRLPPSAQVDSSGFLSRDLDFLQPPTGGGPGMISPGETWLFQFWYRDQVPGGSGFNLSDALEVKFCP